MSNNSVSNNSVETLIEASKFLKASDEFLEIFIEKVTNNKDITPENLGILYENSLYADYKDNSKVSKKEKEGIFYTPTDLVDFIVKNSLKNFTSEQIQNGLLILDPAVGSGIFILRYLEEIVRLTGRITINQILKVFCFDKDFNALQVAKLAIVSKLIHLRELNKFEWDSKTAENLEIFIENNFKLKDTLLDQEGDREAEFKYDLIIGNPPYGLSRGEKITEEENKQIKLIYKEYLNGKPEKYLLFMAKGYQLLNPAGFLSFIVPNSWLAIKSAKKIRELFIKNEALKSITVVDYPAFGNVGVETVIFTIKKNSQSNSYSENSKFIKIKKINKVHEIISSSDVPYEYSKNSKSFLIPTIWNNEAEKILEKVFNQSFLLQDEESPFVSMIALQAYMEGRGTPKQTKDVVKNHVFHFDYKHDETCYPYLEGADVTRFEINWSGKYLSHGPWLAEYHSIERYKNPRILIREILREPPKSFVACYTDETLLYNKSVLHIIPRDWVLESEEIDREHVKRIMKIYSALLNSSLYSLIISLRGIKSQRKLFPKILNEDLKNLPVPKSIMSIAKQESDIDIDGYLNEESCDELAMRVFGLKKTWNAELHALSLSNGYSAGSSATTDSQSHQS